MLDHNLKTKILEAMNFQWLGTILPQAKPDTLPLVSDQDFFSPDRKFLDEVEGWKNLDLENLSAVIVSSLNPHEL